MSRFDDQLDYVNSYFRFELDFTNLSRMKNLVSLVQYIRWNQPVETTTRLMTRNLAAYMGRPSRDHDHLSAGIVKDAKDQLARRSRTILQLPMRIADHQREAIKYRMSVDLLPHCRVAAGRLASDRETMPKQLRRAAGEEGGRRRTPERSPEIDDRPVQGVDRSHEQPPHRHEAVFGGVSG